MELSNLWDMYPLEWDDPFADDDDELGDGWTDDEEENLIRDGICPECGAELDVCGHGADWFDEDEE